MSAPQIQGAVPTREAETELRGEFERQVKTLIQKGYPDVAGISPEAFRQHVEPLGERLHGLAVPAMDMEWGRLPFVIVIRRDLVSIESAMSRVEREGKTGFANLYPVEPDSFRPIEGLIIPGGLAYLLVDIDRGSETLNVTPDEALQAIHRANRSPLTIEEGIAILTHHPDFLQKNRCFSLLASRCGDQRVPALWISAGRPRLGWCWAGNPHTWLGSASCRSRVAV